MEAMLHYRRRIFLKPVSTGYVILYTENINDIRTAKKKIDQ